MAWVEPETRATGELITAAIWNQDVVSNTAHLAANLPQRAVLWHDDSLVVNGAALSVGTSTGQPYNRYAAQSPAANGDSFTQSFVLEAGTYTFCVLGSSDTNRGMIDWAFDGAGTPQVAGQDWYSAAQTNAVILTATVTLSTSGRHTLQGTVNGRNAASTGYQIMLTKLWFVPAADTPGG